MNLNSLFKNIRFYVLSFSAIIAVFVYAWASKLPEEKIDFLLQTYALLAITYLYLTLLASPVTRFFKFLPFRGQYLRARRALGVSAFLFGLLHAYFAFFGEVGGFAALPFLNSTYIIALTLSTTALLILFLMASTAFDFMVDKLSFPKWKMLHRLVYAAGIFIVIHANLIGPHFRNFSNIVSQISFVALAFLLILEAIRLSTYLHKKFPNFPSLGISLFVFLILGSLLLTFFIL